METASDRSKVIECCQRILKGCSENCNPEVIQQIRDTIIFIQNLGTTNLPNIPWLAKELWLQNWCFGRYNGDIFFNPIATDSIKYIYFHALENSFHPLYGCYQFSSCSH